MISLPFSFKDGVMVRKIYLLPIFLLACSLFSPLALPSPTAAPAVTLTLPPLQTDAPTEAPATSPAVTLSAGDFTPILYRDHVSQYNEFQIIGGVQDGEWLPAGQVADQVEFEQAFDLYANGYAGVAITKDDGAPAFNPRCGEAYVGTDFSNDIPNLIGVKQGWDVTYRPGEEVPVNTPVYYAAVADWLVSQGFTLPAVGISRILRVDLEGDGVEEVLISAAHFRDESGHMAEQGDYSIILMRKLVGDQVLTVPVVADLYTSPTAELTFPFTYSLASLLDLNRDGTLELIVDVSRWEGAGVILYQVDGTNVNEVIRAVCTQ